jgi:hypothetical protein
VARRLVRSVPPSAYRHLPVELRAPARRLLGTWEPGDVGYEPVPPRPATGEEAGPPDFVLVGGEDAGAGWWMDRIADHPDVVPHRTLATGARFFARFGTEAFGPDDVARFGALFPRRPGRVTGHWSPDALSYPWVAPLLAEAAPDARILVLVRDPVDQLRAALERTAEDRAPHVGSNLADAVDRGFVADQLVALRAWFPTSQILVQQYERCRIDPDAALARTFAFLGIDDTYRTRSVLPPPEPEREPLAPATRARLVDLYAADVAALVGLVPDLDLGLWPSAVPPE